MAKVDGDKTADNDNGAYREGEHHAPFCVRDICEIQGMAMPLLLLGHRHDPFGTLRDGRVELA